MKQVSANILQFLNDTAYHDSLYNTMDATPNVVHGDVAIEESRNRYETLRNMMIEAIENESFDLIPYNRRNGIWTVLNNIKNNLGNPQQIIAQTEALQDHINVSGLQYLNIGNRNLQTQLEELTKLKRRYTGYVKDFEKTRKTLDFISDKRTELEKLTENAKAINTEMSTIQGDATTKYQGIEQTIKLVDGQKEAVDKKAQEVENKKVNVNAFSNNIDGYKETITDLVKKCNSIIAKDEEISGLIKKAEKALQLREAEGISAAFSARFVASNNNWVYAGWLGSAIVLLLLALVGTIWILIGWGLENANPVTSIIGRIIAVGISITGATFSANQYVKQKNLAEDYAYKATLSKSIVAFREEIEKGEGSIADYLKKVLDEIHQDPLRSRGKDNKTNNLSLDAIKELIQLLKAAKDGA